MAPLASAYQGPPRLTLPGAFTEWTADPAMITLVVVLGLCYLAGVYRVRRNGAEWRNGRTVAFCGLGLGFLVIATMSWVGVYQNILFYARATQTVLLVLLVPLFLAMGKPLTLFTENFPRPGAAIVKGIRSKPARFATFPLITALLLTGVPMTMYFTNWYTATFHSGTARELTFLVLMAVGYLFFWTLLQVDPVPKAYPPGIGLWITAAEVVGDAFFGIAVIADTNILAHAHYLAVGWPYGPTLATNQVLGGGIIWIFGDTVGLPFLAVQFIMMMRADKAEAVEIDAELDAKEAARAARLAARKAEREARAAWRAGEEYPSPQAAGVPAAPADAVATDAVATDTVTADTVTADMAANTAADAVAADDDDDIERPWWENDPRMTNRFGRG
ncbi:MAG TPA: cytochrome c oxidase assembly protein [Trebonia sp.]|jgi:cytochrome c oxidase assembly factor CtaG|nr:cytochrome c oxidase assembly protein [Trebonia sp.]